MLSLKNSMPVEWKLLWMNYLSRKVYQWSAESRAVASDRFPVKFTVHLQRDSIWISLFWMTGKVYNHVTHLIRSYTQDKNGINKDRGLATHSAYRAFYGELSLPTVRRRESFARGCIQKRPIKIGTGPHIVWHQNCPIFSFNDFAFCKFPETPYLYWLSIQLLHVVLFFRTSLSLLSTTATPRTTSVNKWTHILPTNLAIFVI